jgi:hypothetical protein
VRFIVSIYSLQGHQLQVTSNRPRKIKKKRRRGIHIFRLNTAPSFITKIIWLERLDIVKEISGGREHSRPDADRNEPEESEQQQSHVHQSPLNQ